MPPQEKALWKGFFSPFRRIIWFLLLAIVLLVLRFPISQDTNGPILSLLAGAVLYVFVVFQWVLPRWGEDSWLLYGLTILNILIVTFGYYLLYPSEVFVFFIVVIAASGVTLGLPGALLAALFSSAADLGVSVLRGGPTSVHVLGYGFHVVVFVAVAYLNASLANTVHRQSDESTKRNRDLAFLLSMLTTATSSLNLESVLPNLAECIALGLPVTFCRISLLDQANQSLTTWGAFPARSLASWDPGVGKSWSLADLALHRKAIELSQAVVLHEEAEWRGLAVAERSLLSLEGIQSACLAPVSAEGCVVGVISVGEVRHWEREPLDEDKLRLVQALATQIGIVIQNAQLHEATERQAARLAVLNQIGQSLSSTIEMDELLELVYQQIQSVFPTDTYYVGLYDSQSDSLDLRLLIDEGQRFPRETIPVGLGLASVVIRERRPLLIRHLSVEKDSLPVQPIVMGQSRHSESWLGVPLLMQQHLVGLIVVASYRPNTFEEEDIALLKNIAEGVALALENAHHHTEVEEQARRDSLTGAYNHGYFLVALEAAVRRSVTQGVPLSLIMFDIDHFKQYNDTFGHVVGDLVLTQTVRAIKEHLGDADFVGRWGGEEFAICLYGMSSMGALERAETIRAGLAALEIETGGARIAPPTASMGIATIPEHVLDHNTLVLSADRALYQAKRAGRAQVGVAQR